MKPLTLLTLILALIISPAVSAHQDRIIRLNGDKLEGLPAQYQLASFSIEKKKFEFGPVSVTVPDCMWKYFSGAKPEDIRFTASWYHDPDILPPYIHASIPKSGSKNRYELLLNLDTLAVLKFEEAVVDEDGISYEAVPIPPACAAEWKVVRKK